MKINIQHTIFRWAQASPVLPLPPPYDYLVLVMQTPWSRCNQRNGSFTSEKMEAHSANSRTVDIAARRNTAGTVLFLLKSSTSTAAPHSTRLATCVITFSGRCRRREATSMHFDVRLKTVLSTTVRLDGTYYNHRGPLFMPIAAYSSARETRARACAVSANMLH